METLEILEPRKLPTVGEMAASDVRKAEVFKTFGIEFCCGGNKSLYKACEELNLDINEVEQALLKAVTSNKNYSFDYGRWDADFLIDYIYNQHHKFFYDEYPVISKLIEKVVNHHGEAYPKLKRVDMMFSNLLRELVGHFAEEENTVFPLIKDLSLARKNGKALSLENIQKLDAVLQAMQDDHKVAGKVLSELNKVTDNYTPPAIGCNSFKLLYHKLKCLEEDLHQHIHLENNILFDKAIKLKQEMAN